MSELSDDDLTSIDLETAKRLVSLTGENDSLFLDGLTTISKEIAAELAKHTGAPRFQEGVEKGIFLGSFLA